MNNQYSLGLHCYNRNLVNLTLLLLMIILCVFQAPCFAQKTLKKTTFISHVIPPKTKGSRLQYETDLITLALEKTRATYGDYQLNTVKSTHTTLRDISTLQSNKVNHFIRAFAINKDLLNDEDLVHIAFPIMRGSSSYRVCFTSKKNKEKLTRIKNITNLSKFTFVQGLGWPDKFILENAGLTVFESGKKSNVLQMVAHGRADLFCRGLGEFMNEWELYKNEIGNLALDEKILIFYPFPRYFFMHKSNTKTAERLEAGLLIANEDGSFLKLWESYHRKAIEFAKLDERTIFILENPQLKYVDTNFSQYFYPINKDQRTATLQKNLKWAKFIAKHADET